MIDASVFRMERMENVLRRFHLLKEPRDSEARVQLRKELFAYSTVSASPILNERFSSQ